MSRETTHRPPPMPLPHCRPASGSARADGGVGLVASILTLLLVAVIGAALLLSAMSDVEVSANYRANTVALYAADSGLQRTLADYLADRTWVAEIVAPTVPLALRDPFPGSVTINGQTIVLDISGGDVVARFYPLGDPVSLGPGGFARELWLPPTGIELADASGTRAWVVLPVRSTGSAGGAEPSTAVVEADSRVMAYRLSVWGNALFAGTGQGGATIKGNAQVRGSIHIIGDPDNPTLVDWGGGAGMWNNYEGAGDQDNFDADAARLPPLPTRLFNGEQVESLDAELRIRHGSIVLDGSVALGQPDAPGNAHKETLDGVWVEGQVSLDGGATVNADAAGGYDLGDAQVRFPTLDDPYYDAASGTLYPSHRDYLNAGVTLPVNEISADTPAFEVSDAAGNYASWDPDAGTLTIAGVVRVDGDLTIGSTGGQWEGRRVSYQGTGTLYATRDVRIVTDLVPAGNYLDTAQAVVHNLGIVADDDVEIATTGGAPWVKVFAAVYAEGSIRIAKQTRVAGALVSNYFDLGANVPRIWQVPALAANPPPGMPGGDPLLFVVAAELRDWRQSR